MFIFQSYLFFYIALKKGKSYTNLKSYTNVNPYTNANEYTNMNSYTKSCNIWFKMYLFFYDQFKKEEKRRKNRIIVVFPYKILTENFKKHFQWNQQNF